MELEVVVGTYQSSLIGCTIDISENSKKQVLKKKYHEEAHSGCVRCVASGGHYVASGGTDETIKLYNMRRHRDIGMLLQHEGSITSLCFYKNTHLFSTGEDGKIYMWKCGGEWEHLHTLEGHKHSVSCISVHPSGHLALSVGKDRSVRTWNLITGRAAFTLRLPTAASLVAWSPIGDHYVLTVEGTVVVYSVESGEVTATIELGKTVNSILFIKDTILAVGSDDPTISMYSITSGAMVTSLKGHTNRVKGLALSPDDQLLFSASSDGTIRAWSLPDSLEDCECISSVNTGSRLTCITALWPGSVHSIKEVDEAVTISEKKRKRTLSNEDRQAQKQISKPMKTKKHKQSKN